MARCEHEKVRSQCSICRPLPSFNQLRYKAKLRGLSFTITLEEFLVLVAQPCFYCGTLEVPRSLDRVDNRIGYSIKNVVSCCGPHNMLKKDLDVVTFLRLVESVARHQENKRKQKLEQKSTGLVVPESQPPRPGVEQVPGQLKFHNPDISPEARRYLDGARS